MEEQIIQRVPLFASLPEHEIRCLAKTLRYCEFPPHAVIFIEGEQGDRFYILISGQVEIIRGLGTADERLIAVSGPGEYVGEMSLFNRDGLRTASVRARKAVRALEMTRADFDALLNRQPGLAYEMVRVLSVRLDEAHDAAIRDLQEKNRELAEAYEELKAAQAQIVEKERLERELDVARRIQTSLLPQRLPQLPDFDLGARMMPMEAVGGDFFDLIPLNPDSIGICVGDVSGHGVPAALLMAMTVILLRAEACRDCSPEAVLRAVNRQLLNTNQEGMFVTMLYGVLSRGMRTFSYARAGHEPPILCDASGESSSLELGHGQLLGLFENPPLDEKIVTLAPHSTLVLYTDGAVEAVDGSAEMFGEERLHQVIRNNHRDAAQTVCERILEEVSAHTKGAAQRDDITLVCVQAL